MLPCWCRCAQVTSLRRLLDNDVLEHLERITELSDSASREYSIEKALDKMVADWEGLAFELGTWKNTGTHILKGDTTCSSTVCHGECVRCSKLLLVDYSGRYKPYACVLLYPHPAKCCKAARCMRLQIATCW